MPLYEDRTHAENVIPFEPGLAEQIVYGAQPVLAEVLALADYLAQCRARDSAEPSVVVYGCGEAVADLCEAYDLVFYFDKIRQPILWDM